MKSVNDLKQAFIQKGADVVLVPHHKRSCTDVFFLLLYVAFSLATVGGWVYATEYGINASGGIGISTARATRLYDYEGNVCGAGSMSDKPYVFFPMLPGSGASIDATLAFRLCVSDCKKTLSATQDEAPGSNLDQQYLHNYILGTDVRGYPSKPLAKMICVPDLAAVPGLIADSLTPIDGVSPVSSRDVRILQTDAAQEFIDRIKALSAVLDTDVMVFLDEWWMVPAGAGLSLVLFLMYMVLLRYFGGVVVWLSVIAVGAALLIIPASVLLNEQIKAGPLDINLGETVGQERQAWEIASYAMLVLLLVYVGVVLWFKSKIATAVAVLGESIHAILDVPSMMFFPLLMLVAMATYLAFWVTGFLLFFALHSGPMQTIEITEPFVVEPFEVRGRSSVDMVLLGVHIFGLLWNLQFLTYFAYITLAGTVSTWYFTPEDSQGRKHLQGSTLRDSIHRTLRFHIGTVAFGSLVLAIIGGVGSIVKFIDDQTKERNNQVQKALRSCFWCCLKCMVPLVDYITQDGMVFTAIYGESLWKGGEAAVALIKEKDKRATAVGFVGKYITLIGKLFVVMSSGLMFALLFWLYPEFKNDNHSLSVVLIMAVAYLVAAAFFEVFDVALDTIYMCFLIDEKNASHGAPFYASDRLMKLMEVSEHVKTLKCIEEPPRSSRGGRRTAAGDTQMIPLTGYPRIVSLEEPSRSRSRDTTRHAAPSRSRSRDTTRHASPSRSRSRDTKRHAAPSRSRSRDTQRHAAVPKSPRDTQRLSAPPKSSRGGLRPAGVGMVPLAGYHPMPAGA